MKKIFALLLTLSLLCSLFAGCGSVTEPAATTSKNTPAASDNAGNTGAQSESATAQKTLKDEVVVALSADPADLTPCKPNGIGRSNFFWTIYETLFDYDANNNFVSNLATGYTIVSPTEWDVTIFENIYDSEGNHITADDVVNAVTWLVDSGNNIRYNLFESIEKIDEYTVRYHWTEEPASLADLEWPLCRTFIFSKTAWENHNFAVDPVGTGCYVVESFTAGSSLILARNENYWANNTDEDVSMRVAYHNANVGRIVYNVIPESVSAVIALEMGTVDFCDYVPVASLSEFEEGGAYADRFVVETTLSNDYYFLMPNMSASSVVGNDLNLRLAIYYALDNEQIATAMGGSYIAMQTLGNEAFGDFDPSWAEEATYVNTCNVEKAKEYLAQSDYNGEEIVIVGMTTEECKNAMMMIQNLLVNQLGLNVTIQPYEKSFLQTVTVSQEGWDFQLSSSGGQDLIGTWSALFSHEENNGYTNSWMQDPTLEQLYRTASADATHDSEHMKECMDYAFSVGCVYPLTALSSSLVYNAGISKIVYRESYWVIGACEVS